MNLAAAWEITGGGYALVAQVDMGTHVNHPLLKQWEGGSYVGGNLIQAASKDVGLTGLPGQPGFNSADIDEAKPEWIVAGPCTPTDSLLAPAHLGHGTHVAGLLGANADAGLSVRGTCKHCGIAVYRSAYLQCALTSPPQVLPHFNDNSANRAKAEAIDTGAQEISMSFGSKSERQLQLHRKSEQSQLPDDRLRGFA
jgi:hypothetical protein